MMQENNVKPYSNIKDVSIGLLNILKHDKQAKNTNNFIKEQNFLEDDKSIPDYLFDNFIDYIEDNNVNFYFKDGVLDILSDRLEPLARDVGVKSVGTKIIALGKEILSLEDKPEHSCYIFKTSRPYQINYNQFIILVKSLVQQLL